MQKRIEGLDIFKGLILILMALDHVSYFQARIHFSEYWGIPMPEYGSLMAFFTRSITHLCAPGFAFSMGMGMVLFKDSRKAAGWKPQQIRSHFIRRGAIMLLVQVVVNIAWLLGSIRGEGMSNPVPGEGMGFLYLGVFYSLGMSLIIGSFLVSSSWKLILPLGLGSILIPQIIIPMFDGPEVYINPVLRLLTVPGISTPVMVNYSLFPWIGVVLLGMLYAKSLKGKRSLQWSFIGGSVLLALFFLIRFIGEAGNFYPPGEGLQFWTLVKYPASLSFLLLTMGINLIIIGILLKFKIPTFLSPLREFGKVPLFFYLVHIFFYALMSLIIPTIKSYLFIYLFWLSSLILFYFLCRKYSNFKKAKSM